MMKENDPKSNHEGTGANEALESINSGQIFKCLPYKIFIEKIFLV